jgi:hypothetical protein
MSLDAAREAAVEAGYLRDHGDETGGTAQTNIDDLLQAIDRETRGQRVYPEGADGPARPVDPDELAYHRESLEAELDRALSEAGIEPKTVAGPMRARVLEIMDREIDRDPVDAYERATMEEDLRGVEAGHLEPDAEKIPGWDLVDDAGEASPAGAPVESAGNGEGEGARGAPRGRGDADRATQPDWRSLALARPDDADFAEASREADKTEAPTSAESPARSVSAAQAAAGEADKLLADILPSLSEDERKTFEDALANLENDRAAREQIVRDGAACLAQAVA